MLGLELELLAALRAEKISYRGVIGILVQRPLPTAWAVDVGTNPRLSDHSRLLSGTFIFNGDGFVEAQIHIVSPSNKRGLDLIPPMS